MNWAYYFDVFKIIDFNVTVGGIAVSQGVSGTVIISH